MNKVVVFPSPEQPPGTLEELVEKVHDLAKNSTNVWIVCSHAKQRMQKRTVSLSQIFDVLRQGKISILLKEIADLEEEINDQSILLFIDTKKGWQSVA